jgi:phosphomevalonate kinase
MGASAPGKALLCGEYAVLEGAPAVVAAVDRRVRVVWTDEQVAMSPEVEATLRRAQTELGPVGRALRVDTSELHQDRMKLGLGSSAAAATAAAGAVFASYGQDIADQDTLQRLFACAFEGHASIAPQGSGVDVAASTFGGFLRFERDADHVETRSLAPPKELHIRLIWTGQAARTSDLVRKVKELRRNDSPRYDACMHLLVELAARFASAFELQNPASVVAEAAAYCAAMKALGDAAGAPILEERLERAAELAARFSGSAKPCGAGGGDVAIAFFVESKAANRFALACKDEGLHPIEVSWGASGVQAC